jgi:hypothetical protein
MRDKVDLINQILAAFAENEYPGDAFLQGSTDGCEPYEVVSPFQGKKDWRTVDPETLDSSSEALSFFSEAAFRFFLPAYIVADIQGRLERADPLFHLTHGFCDESVEIPSKDGVLVRQLGESALVNPLRYGAMTFADYSRYRMSIFTKEESGAIVAYLKFKRDSDSMGLEREKIEAALRTYWLARAEEAPSAERLKQHLENQSEFLKRLE